MTTRRMAAFGTVALTLCATATAQDASLVAPSSSGHDGAFFIASDEHRLDVNGFLQYRWAGNYRDSQTPGESDWESGFEFRRLRLTFEGDLYDGAIGFRITNSFSRSTGEDSISDAFLTFALTDDATLRAGQFKLPFTREELTSAKRLLAADRSYTNAVFSLRRSQGVALELDRDEWNAVFAISDGADNANSASEDDGSDFALTTRVEHVATGDFRQFRAASAFPGAEDGWLLGAALHAEWSANTPADPSQQVVAWTLDSSWQTSGASAMLAYIGRYSSDGDDGAAATDHGVVAQVSRFVDERTELFARYDAVIPDSDRAGDDIFNVVTLGFNHYLHGHAAKFTADVQWFPDPASENDLAGTESGVGYLDSGSAHDEVVIRAQFQLLF